MTSSSETTEFPNGTACLQRRFRERTLPGPTERGKQQADQQRHHRDGQEEPDERERTSAHRSQPPFRSAPRRFAGASQPKWPHPKLAAKIAQHPDPSTSQRTRPSPGRLSTCASDPPSPGSAYPFLRVRPPAASGILTAEVPSIPSTRPRSSLPTRQELCI